jgi:hypothetical protein
MAGAPVDQVQDTARDAKRASIPVLVVQGRSAEVPRGGEVQPTGADLSGLQEMVMPNPMHPDVLHFAAGLTYAGVGDGHGEQGQRSSPGIIHLRAEV